MKFEELKSMVYSLTSTINHLRGLSNPPKESIELLMREYGNLFVLTSISPQDPKKIKSIFDAGELTETLMRNTIFREKLYIQKDRYDNTGILMNFQKIIPVGDERYLIYTTPNLSKHFEISMSEYPNKIDIDSAFSTKRKLKDTVIKRLKDKVEFIEKRWTETILN